jgi:hypothetical protein
MTKKSREDSVLGDFHESTGQGHPKESIGNQQVWGPGGSQVGTIEYKPNPNGGLDLELNNKKGDKIADL